MFKFIDQVSFADAANNRGSNARVGEDSGTNKFRIG
jgi:hypothetical protein